MAFQSVNFGTVLSDRKADIDREILVLEQRIVDLGRESDSVDVLISILQTNPEFENAVRVLNNIPGGEFKTFIPDSIVVEPVPPVIP